MIQIDIRQRLRSLRERQGVTQSALSDALGFNDRQTLSDIEQGRRNVSPEELIRAARFFGVSAEYFTDPLELAGEACFSWRKTVDDVEDLEPFEAKAGSWIATFRHLSRLRGEPVNSVLMRVGITKSSSLEEATEEGDAVSQALDLGEVPAWVLPSVLEERLNTLVLYVDAGQGVSGAACQLGPLNTIIINRGESEGRRSFDLGHEFFHLLTWAEMPPRHLEVMEGGTKSERRIENLADSFASGLLMPRHHVSAFMEQNPMPGEESEIAPWVKSLASHFCVSGQALKWRLVNLGILKKAAARRIENAELRMDALEEPDVPARFSKQFVETLGWGIEMGHLSVRKAAKVVGTTVDDLANLFAEHGLRTPFDL